MSQANSPTPAQLGANLQLKGGAAIVAPLTAFPNGLPQNALVLLPLRKPTDEFMDKLQSGAIALTPEQMWELLGFNGPPVQVQDNEGRPISIGLEDLIEGLDKHWKEDETDLNRGRMYASELMKHGRAAAAEKVLAKVVARGGTGEDWLGLGVAQAGAEQWDRAESTLKGAQNLLADNPFPSLHLAKVYRAKENLDAEKAAVHKAITIEPNAVDAWAYLYTATRRNTDSEDAAINAVKELAEAEPNKKSAAPYVALQGLYAAKEETRDKALEFAKVAVTRDPDNSLALVALSALHGQNGDLPAIIELLSKHEGKMTRDVRLANNYFEALFQSRQLDKVTKLLNALAGSPNREVKQFAIERSRAVAQFLQQQQQALKDATATASR
jgi:tetratricopeptide (TPR) repeat protein